MTDKDERLLIDNGWTVECESPFEIFHAESGSRATRDAADLVLWTMKQECQILETEKPKFEYKWEQLKIENVEKIMNSLGKEGWELVSANQEARYTNAYFKRQI